MAMRIVPSSSHLSSHSQLAPHTTGAPSAPGLHDTLRHGVGPVLTPQTSTQTNPQPDSTHPLESRLLRWETTQETAKMNGLRRTFGMSEPIRRGMELKITMEGEWRPMVLSGGVKGVHEEILRGTDTGITWEDVYTGTEMRSVMGVQEEMERRVGMGL